MTWMVILVGGVVLAIWGFLGSNRRPSSSTSTISKVAVSIVQLVAVLLLAVVGIGLLLISQQPSRPTTSQSDQIVPSTKPRYEFDSLVSDKTREDVIKAVGVPDSRQQSGAREYWYYNGKTHDTLTNKVDHSVQLVFDYGRVKDVNFY